MESVYEVLWLRAEVKKFSYLTGIFNISRVQSFIVSCLSYLLNGIPAFKQG